MFRIFSFYLIAIFFSIECSVAAKNNDNAIYIIYSCGDINHYCTSPIGRWESASMLPLFDKPASHCKSVSTSPICVEYFWGSMAKPLSKSFQKVKSFPIYLDGQMIGNLTAKNFNKRIDNFSLKFSDKDNILHKNILMPVIATKLLVSPARGWKKITLDQADRKYMLEKVKNYIKATYGNNAFKGFDNVPNAVFEFYTIYRTNKKKIEFASVTFGDRQEEQFPAYSISLAWGLTNNDQPIVFSPYQQVGSQPFQLGYRLISAIDIENDGLIELFFAWGGSIPLRYKIWQGNSKKGYRQIAEVRIWPE